MGRLLASYHAAARKLGIPAGSTIELLAPCNLRCTHCYVSHNAKNRLTLPVLDNLFRQMRDMGSFYVTLTGGEIGLRKDLFEIIALARSLRFAVNLLSSGTRWGEREWDRLAALGINDVQVSLYGVTARTHDAVTLVPGSFERTVATIEGLLARGVPLRIATPVMHVNVHEAADVLEWAIERDIPLTFDPNIHAMDSGDPSPKATLAAQSALIAFFQDPRFQDYFQRIMPDAACSSPDPNRRPCGTGEASSFVQCTGEVYPCVVWPRSGGNILHTSYADIWYHSDVFKQARGVTFATSSACGSCGDRGVCSPCAAMNLQDQGSLQQPSPTVCNTTAALAIALKGHSDQPHRLSQPGAQGGHARLPIVA